MSLSKLKLLSVIGVKEKLDEVVDVLGSCGCFHTEDVLSLYSDTKGFEPISDENIYDKHLHEMIKVVSDLNKTYLEMDDKTKKKFLPPGSILEYVEEFKNNFSYLMDKKTQLHRRINELITSEKRISRFTGMNLNFDTITKCEYIKIRLGRLPNESIDKLERYKNPYVLFFTGTTDQMYHWGMYVAPIDHVDEVDTIFSGLSFERLRIYDVKTTPEEEIISINREIERLQAEYDEVLNEIDKKWEAESKKASAVFAEVKRLYTYNNIKKQGAEYNRCFIVAGWIPEEDEKKIRKKLKKISAIESLAEDSDKIKSRMVPSKLKNKKIFKPFEQFITMYGVPYGNEIDPTVFVSITYTLIFGMMFGDFGNGLVLSIAGYIMNKFLNLPIGKVLVPCGISSMAFGVLFGSNFGFENAFDWFYIGVLKMQKKPISAMESDMISNILLAAVGVGVVFIVIAMILNIYSSLKQKRYGRALFGANGVAGLVFYVSLLLGFGLNLVLGVQILNIAYVIILIIVPILLIMFEPVLADLIEYKTKPEVMSWKPESMSEFIMQAFFETLEVLLSFATNTISFLRIGAYVLVHEGMLLVVFTLAEMSGMGSIPYWIIIVIGNIVVIGLEGLLVSIQTLRLEFYEMFSRFYEGGGRDFKPVSVPSNSEIMSGQA